MFIHNKNFGYNIYNKILTKMENNENQLSKKLQNFLDFLPNDFDLLCINHQQKIRDGLDSALFYNLGQQISMYYNQCSIEIDDSEIVENEEFLDAIIKRFPNLEY